MLAIKTILPHHSDCTWRVSKTGMRVYHGQVAVPCLFLTDLDCSTFESFPLSPSGEYVLIGDSLREHMGWRRGRFTFGGASWWRRGTMEALPHVGLYQPFVLYAADEDSCNSSAS